MTDEINDKRIEYLKQHIEQVHQICDGCVLNEDCKWQTRLLSGHISDGYKCEIREFLEKEIKKMRRKLKRMKTHGTPCKKNKKRGD